MLLQDSRSLICDSLGIQFKCVATMPVSPELPLAFFEDVAIREKVQGA